MQKDVKQLADFEFVIPPVDDDIKVAAKLMHDIRTELIQAMSVKL